VNRFGWIVALLCLGACAAPSLSVYTLRTPATAHDRPPLGKTPVVIAVSRVTIPDELDTEDIVVRDGMTLRRSRLGRWASRLSLGITDRITQRLAARYPGALVTDRPLTATATDRVLINISRFDVGTTGATTLDADWVVVPHDPAKPTRRDRLHVATTGSVASDQDVVSLMGASLDRLAGAIDIPGLR